MTKYCCCSRLISYEEENTPCHSHASQCDAHSVLIASAGDLLVKDMLSVDGQV
jgi:hypothetical protein